MNKKYNFPEKNVFYLLRFTFYLLKSYVYVYGHVNAYAPECSAHGVYKGNRLPGAGNKLRSSAGAVRAQNH